MRHDVEFSCGPVAMETVWKEITMYQNEKQKYEIKADYVEVKLFKFAEQLCNTADGIRPWTLSLSDNVK